MNIEHYYVNFWYCGLEIKFICIECCIFLKCEYGWMEILDWRDNNSGGLVWRMNKSVRLLASIVVTKWLLLLTLNTKDSKFDFQITKFHDSWKLYIIVYFVAFGFWLKFSLLLCRCICPIIDQQKNPYHMTPILTDKLFFNYVFCN